MSEYPDDVKVSRRTIYLVEPKPGYEWVRRDHTETAVIFEQRPIRKRYDWSKTSRHVIVLCNETCNQISLGQAVEPCRLVTMLWQAHIGGDPCPVDPDATMVEYHYGDRTLGPYKASSVDWSVDRIYRVTGLADGYSYK